MIAFPNIENFLPWIIQRSNLSGVKGSDLQKLYEVSFPTKNIVPIFDERDFDGNLSSIFSDSSSISQKEEQRGFGDSAKKKNRETETEREAKRNDKNDSDELTE